MVAEPQIVVTRCPSHVTVFIFLFSMVGFRRISADKQTGLACLFLLTPGFWLPSRAAALAQADGSCFHIG